MNGWLIAYLTITGCLYVIVGFAYGFTVALGEPTRLNQGDARLILFMWTWPVALPLLLVWCVVGLVDISFE